MTYEVTRHSTDSRLLLTLLGGLHAQDKATQLPTKRRLLFDPIKLTLSLLKVVIRLVSARSQFTMARTPRSNTDQLKHLTFSISTVFLAAPVTLSDIPTIFFDENIPQAAKITSQPLPEPDRWRKVDIVMLPYIAIHRGGRASWLRHHGGLQATTTGVT